MRCILVGAGHAHLYVAAQAEKFAKYGVETILISPDLFWYSGLATGMLGGHYTNHEDQVDPKKLIETHGGTFIQAKLKAIDPEQKTLTLSNGETLSFDVVSLNLGSEVSTKFEIDSDQFWNVKPISELWDLRKVLKKKFTEEERLPHLVVIGGGPTGCEIAANLRALSQYFDRKLLITIVTQSPRLMSHSTLSVSAKVKAILLKKEIEIITNETVKKVEKGTIITDRQTYPADCVINASGLVAPQIVKTFPMERSNTGELLVTPQLQSVSHEGIFGGGDCISIQGYALPKIGVYGVREAPILAHNLKAFLLNQPLKTYHPQKSYLTILNMGDGTALAIRNSLYWHGALSFWLKDWIDRSFLDTYRK
ncbi:MAG: FAD-dependent oxidoreductase [Chlamydiales bacterium]